MCFCTFILTGGYDTASWPPVSALGLPRAAPFPPCVRGGRVAKARDILARLRRDRLCRRDERGVPAVAGDRQPPHLDPAGAAANRPHSGPAAAPAAKQRAVRRQAVAPLAGARRPHHHRNRTRRAEGASLAGWS